MTKLADRRQEELFKRVTEIIEAARGHVARTVNSAMVQAYWLIGREIVEVEQHGEKRAGYGEGLMKRVATRLSAKFGKGFSLASLKRMKQFYLAFPRGSALVGAGDRKGSTLLSLSADAEELEKGSAVLSLSPGSSALFPPSLAWSHYLVLLRVTRPEARAFYEIEAARESWSVRELERQVGALLFDRIAKNKSPDQVLEMVRDGQQVSVPSDVIKDPFVLEFLGLDDRAHLRERDLEQTIIDRIEGFLLELGKGFCFVARQKRVTIEGDHFYVDLVFYNRLLRCFVLVDLKLGKLTHQDLGQMQMFVNFFDRFQRAEHEAKTIGIVLCSEKNDAMVRITLPDENEQVLAASYPMYLPTEEELRAALEREREEAERVQRLTVPYDDSETNNG